MKTFRFLFLIAIFVGLMVGCNKDELTSNDEVQLKSTQTIKVTLPFEANLLGEIDNFDPAATECTDEGYLGRVIVEATGNATHMGKVSTTFNFCTLGPENPDLPTPNITYGGFVLEVTAANGDVLYLSADGSAVITGRLDYHPDYVVDYWQDELTVLGGTGKFEGASGVLTEDDYTGTKDDYTHHHFYGEITLVKGKQ